MEFNVPARHAPSGSRSLGLLVLSTLVASAAAQTTTSLSPVVVTATREPISLDRVAADVVVIDRDAIANSTADSVEDLLRREAGIQVSRNGGPGQSAGVSIRGANVSQTVVLIDGVRVGSSTLGQVAFEGISLTDIDHIEVLRGPGSSLYGADAVGGVVQIFTRRGGAASRFGAQAAVGGYASGQAEADLSGMHGDFDYSASVGHEQSKGVSALLPGDPFGNYNPDRDGYTRDTGQVRIGYAPAAGHHIGLNVIETHLNAQYDSGEFPPPNYVQDSTPDFRNHLTTSLAALDYRGTLSPTWTTTAQLSHEEEDLKSGGNLVSRYVTRRDQATWQNAWTPMQGQQFVGALEYIDERATADGYTGPVGRRNEAAVLGYAGTFGIQSLQADVRYDRNSVYGGVTTGRLGWSMALLPGLRVRALAGTTYRAPSFNDLYYPGYGVPTIQPEHGRSMEVGLNWQSGDTTASATAYRNLVRDLIVYQPDRSHCPSDPSYDFGCADNVDHARLQGVTLSGSERWGGFSLSGTIDFVDAIDTTLGQRLGRRAAHQESLTADYTSGTWSVGAALLDVGARPDGGSTLAAYATLDLQASWAFAPHWRAQAKLLNAGDRRYQPALGYQALGRQGWIGVRYEGQGL
ncbi:MAG: TonB-dependent receptor [Proteobacteria bacterium]|nr:TonB-dependent receptor [Pseudomonadota bacterium]